MSQQKVNNEITLEQIIAARNWLGLSQKDVAKDCGVSRTYLCLLERGKIKSEKLKSKIVDLYEQAGIYFIVDDTTDVPGGKGIVYIQDEKEYEAFMAMKRGPVNKSKLLPPRGKPEVPKVRVVDEPKRQYRRRSIEDADRHASRRRDTSDEPSSDQIGSGPEGKFYYSID